MRKYLLLLAIGGVLMGCKQEINGYELPDSAIEINADIVSTKATPSTPESAGAWENGDKLGLYISSGAFLTSNVEYIYDLSQTKFTSATGLFYFGYANHDIFGYYPRITTAPIKDLATTPLAFSVKGDQSSAADYTQSDLMYAKKSNQIPQTSGSPAVDLEFMHKLSNIRVVLKNTRDEVFVGANAPVVKIVGTNLNANLNLVDGSVAASATADVKPILMKVDGVYSEGVAQVDYYAIAVPQTVYAGTELFHISVGGVVYAVTLTADFTFESGKEHKFDITNSGVDLVIGGGEVVEWGEGAKGSATGGGDGVQPCKLFFSFKNPIANIVAVSGVELTIDGKIYNSTSVEWVIADNKLKVIFDQGSNWGYKLEKVVVKGALGAVLATFENLTTEIKGDPTSAGYNEVINL